MPAHEIVLTLERVSKRFGEFEAVHELSLSVPRGCVYGFLGPNGAGKTTTIRMILGIYEPSAGRIDLLGQPSMLPSSPIGSPMGGSGPLPPKFPSADPDPPPQLAASSAANTKPRRPVCVDRSSIAAARRAPAIDKIPTMVSPLRAATPLPHFMRLPFPWLGSLAAASAFPASIDRMPPTAR